MSRTDKDRPRRVQALDFTEKRPGRRPQMHHYRCEKYACDPRWCTWDVPLSFFGHPPKWFVDHHWNNPERVRERDLLGETRKEYNAVGDLADGDFPCWQPRHGARWNWE